MQKQVKRDKNILITDIKKYIKIIEKEYGEYTTIEKNIDFESIVHIEDTNTISLFIRNREFYFPLLAYDVLNKFKRMGRF